MERMRTFAPQTWLRCAPHADADGLLTIPADTEPGVLEAVGSYDKVSYQTQSGEQTDGFVSQSFLRPIGDEDEPVRPKQSGDDGWLLPPPRFDRTTGWLAAGIALLLITKPI